MKNLLKTTLILAALIHPAPAAESTEAAKLAGTYEIVSGQYGKEEIPKERLEGKVRWGTETIAAFDDDEKKLYAAAYTLDTATEPWTINMTGTMVPKKEDAEAEKFKSKGLVKLEGDKLTLIYSTKDGETPDDFEPEEEDHLFVFRKTASE